MQELIAMLRTMAGACKSIAATNPQAYAQAVQYALKGNLPGIRTGLGNGIMVRVVIEKENNAENKEAEAWNTLWVDPEHEGTPF